MVIPVMPLESIGGGTAESGAGMGIVESTGGAASESTGALTVVSIGAAVESPGRTAVESAGSAASAEGSSALLLQAAPTARRTPPAIARRRALPNREVRKPNISVASPLVRSIDLNL